MNKMSYIISSKGFIMKKLFLMLLFLPIFLLTTACSDDTDMTTAAVIFTRPECTNTSKAIDFFNQLRNKNSLITYQIKDLSAAENRLLIQKFAKKHYISVKKLYTPIVFTPKGYSSGWNEKTPVKLKHLLNVR